MSSPTNAEKAQETHQKTMSLFDPSSHLLRSMGQTNSFNAVSQSYYQGQNQRSIDPEEAAINVPVRDSSTLKGLKYGPGHEKYPSWPCTASSEAPVATRAPPTGGSHRSKSWTDRTDYPKESVVAYARPFMRRHHMRGSGPGSSQNPNQLKTVLENFDKLPSSKERQKNLTQAELEEFTRTNDQSLNNHHKQSSYAQSEGYYSYVSSTDSTSTPFLDRLRQDIDVTRGDTDSLVTTSSGSASSSETLKWHGSLSDISVGSSSYSCTSKDMIAHSASVKTPQRHQWRAVRVTTNNAIETQISVAERVSELEKQNAGPHPDLRKSPRIIDPALKAKQKSALLSFYERCQQKENKNNWRSEPQLAGVPPQMAPPPVRQQTVSRRASTASDYGSWRDDASGQLSNSTSVQIQSKEADAEKLSQIKPPRLSPNSTLEAPVIVGPEISLDDWKPERPPKNSKLLRNVFPDLYEHNDRVASPELPLPSPPTVFEDEVCDEPFPPPPPLEVTNEIKCPSAYSDQKLMELRRNHHAEKVLQHAVPMRSTIRTTASGLPENKPLNHSTVIDKESVDNFDDISKITIKSSVLPFKQNILKRVYPSNHDNKSIRNSFKTAQVTPAHTNVDIRSSMKTYRGHIISEKQIAQPQKMVALPLKNSQSTSAQKQLMRSTTVNEIGTNKPVDQFLRSTSLNLSDNTAHSMPIDSIHKQKSERASLRCTKAGINLKLSMAFSVKSSDLDTSKSRRNSGEQYYSKSSICDRIEVRKIEIGDAECNIHPLADSNKSVSSKCTLEEFNMGKYAPPPLFPREATAPSPPTSALPPKHKSPEPQIVSHTRASLENRKVLPCQERTQEKRSLIGQEVVRYAPSRATHHEASVGSYKLIGQKDEVECAGRGGRLPDVLTEPTRGSSPFAKSPPTPEITPKTPLRTPNFDVEVIAPPQKAVEIVEPPNVVSKENSTAVVAPSVQEPKQENTPLVSMAPSQADGNVLLKKDVIREARDERMKESIEVLTARLTDTYLEDNEEGGPQQAPSVPVPPREEMPVEVECRRACRAFARRLPANHHLRAILSIPQGYKNPRDFIKDVFRLELTKEEAAALEKDPLEDTASQKSSDEEQNEESEIFKDENEMNEELNKLIDCVGRLILALEKEEEILNAKASANNLVGGTLYKLLKGVVQNKFQKLNSEVGHIALLMTGLSARLARTENLISSGLHDAKIDIPKREKLLQQLSEAGDLKANIDKRSITVSAAMAEQLDAEGMKVYRNFIATKAKLIIDRRDVLGRLDIERQKKRCLMESLSKR